MSRYVGNGYAGRTRKTEMPAGLRFKPITEADVPLLVKRGKWRARVSQMGLTLLSFSTQSCRYVDDDGAVLHFAFVERKGRRKGPWLCAIERLGQDCSLSS